MLENFNIHCAMFCAISKKKQLDNFVGTSTVMMILCRVAGEAQLHAKNRMVTILKYLVLTERPAYLVLRKTKGESKLISNNFYRHEATIRPQKITH
jgi:hypothetical protein